MENRGVTDLCLEKEFIQGGGINEWQGKKQVFLSPEKNKHT